MSMHKGMTGKVGPASVELLEQCYKSGQITEQQWQEHLMTDKTLGDYIARKQRHDAFNQVKEEKKLTFDEWFKQINAQHGLPPAHLLARWAWYAGRINQ